MSFLKELQWRGLVADHSSRLPDVISAETMTGYIGFDPTAASLHVGSLVPLMCLARFQRAGHKPIAIAGGGTGMIGDPSGKTAERSMMTIEEIEHNVNCIQPQLERFLDFEAKGNPATLVNNADWLTTIPLTVFLRDIGKRFTLGYMTAKDSVKKRHEEGGISFTELSYMLLQAYDYLVLHDRFGCNLQMGGSDQWGNITAGMDLIHKTRGADVEGLVFPLVANSSGTKFGKTESGAVWLDGKMTSPYAFYQFFLNADDADVERYLKFFTWHDQEAIADCITSHNIAPEKRHAQRMLADSVTDIIHGSSTTADVRKAGEALFGSDQDGLREVDWSLIYQDVPHTEMSAEEAGALKAVDAMVLVGFATSKSQARQLLEAGSFSANLDKVTVDENIVAPAGILPGGYVLLKKGRKTVHLLKIVE